MPWNVSRAIQDLGVIWSLGTEEVEQIIYANLKTLLQSFGPLLERPEHLDGLSHVRCPSIGRNDVHCFNPLGESSPTRTAELHLFIIGTQEIASTIGKD